MKKLHYIKIIIYKLNNYILNPLEKKLIKNYTNKKIKYPPIFIIGAPRTGSTILYEYITNYLDLKYINNFLAKFYKNLYIASIISHQIFADKTHNCFDSKHGRTYGLKAPSECGAFWYRWLPNNRHFIDFDEIDEKSKEEMYSTITAITNKFNKPLIFKNLNAGQRLRMIKEIFPNALFIYIKRDPLFTSQSILRSREKTYNDRSKWWSIMPKEYEQLLKLPYPEQIVKQVYYLQKQIETDLHLFPGKNRYILTYKEFCQNPGKVIYSIKEFLEKNYNDIVYLKDKNIQNKTYYSADKKIDNKTFKKLKKEVNKLNW
ncbi:MAG: sulfotransferase [archaeon]